MPFDPKLILPEEPPLTPEGDLQLPDDLTALAEQLTDDARFLATRYPAVRETAAVSLPGREPSAARRRRLVQAAILIGSTLATLLVALVIAQQMGDDPSAVPISAAVPGQAPESTVRPASRATTTAAATLAPAAGLAIPAGGPTISLTDLSGPELEAVFDLWQRGEGDDATGIAF